MKNIYSTLVMLCAFFMVFTPSYAQDVEPNDDAYSAIAAPTNMPINGTLFSSQVDTIDWFLVNLNETGAVNIQVMPMGSLDAVLKVYKSDDGGLTQYLLETADLGTIGFAETISNPDVGIGMYYIVVETKSGEGQYMLNINFTPGQINGGTAYLLDNFNDGDQTNNLGGAWYSFSDNTSGGASTITMAIAEGSEGPGISADYELNIGTLIYDPYVLIGTQLSGDNTPIDLSQSTGISFMYKGSAAIFDIIEPTKQDGTNYQIAIPASADWTPYTYLWTELAQPNWVTTPTPLDLSKIQSFQWRVQSMHGEIGSIQIDNVEILDYQPIQNQDSVLVTFKVYLGSQQVSPDGIWISGSFVDWDTQKAIQLTQVDTIFQTTLLLPINQVVEFKYINGIPTDWGNYEILSGLPCASPQFENRSLMVSQSMTLPIVCYAQCGPCAMQQPFNLTISSDVTAGQAPLNVQFTAQANANIMQWMWNFGDGQSSTMPAPNHMYSMPGVYTVVLLAIDDMGIQSQATTIINVNAPSGNLNPIITVNNNAGYIPFVVNFSGQATGNIVNWQWDFGDGTFGSGQFTSHSYTIPGDYYVTLTVTDDKATNDSYSIYISAWQPSTTLKADFWANNYSNYAPFTVNFSDYSDGSPGVWEWDFNNDGIIDSYDQNPTFVYENPGTYTVKLIIRNALAQSDSITKYDFIEVWEPQQIDPYCDMSIPAMKGQNYLDFSTTTINDFGRYVKWYSYTATTNILVKIDLCNSGYNNWAEVFDIYKDCNGSFADQIKRSFCNNLGYVELPVMQGQTIYFSIASEGSDYGQQGMTFEVSERPIAPGNICSMPKASILGVNSANTTVTDDWFLFTCPNNGYYEISSCGRTTLDTDLEIYQSCTSYPWLSSSNDCGLQSKVFFHAAMGDPIYISWKDFNSKGNFDWEIKYLGEYLVYPEFYSNTNFGVDSAQIYFYNTSVNAVSYKWDFNNDGITDSNLENPMFTYMQPGFYSVKLEITGMEGPQTVTKSIVKPDYILVQKSASQDPYCQQAKPATIGQNNMSVIDGNSQWYSYTADFEGKLIINTVLSNYPSNININDIFEGCANMTTNYNRETIQNKDIVTIQVSPGKTYYFSVSIYGYMEGFTNISFELIKQLPQPGDICNLPIVLQGSSIQSIQNQNPGMQYSNFEKWYSFTAPADGMIEANTCINQDMGYLHTEFLQSCNLNNPDNFLDYRNKECSNGGNGYNKYLEVKAGQTIFIRVIGQVTQVAQWQFIFRDFYTGEVCTKPLLAKVGLNSIPSGLGNAFYTYTATDNGIVTLSNCQYTDITENSFSATQVRTTCDKETTEIIQYGMANCGTSNGANIAFEVETGKTYILEWYTHVQNWDLEFIKGATLPAGFTCQNPIVITDNQTTVEPTGNITWFEFSFPQSGTVALSSDLNQEATIFIFDMCTPLTENMENTVPYVMNDTAIIFWPEANKTYKLLIIFEELIPQAPYTLKRTYLSNDSQPANIVCADAKPLSLGAQTTTTQYNNYWYSYNAKANTYLHLNFNNELFQQKQVYPEIYYECPSPFEHGDNYIPNMYFPCGNNLPGLVLNFDRDTTIYIQFKSKANTETVQWTLQEYSKNSAELLSFASLQQVSNAVINAATKTITCTLAQSSNGYETSIDFQASPGALVSLMPLGFNICPGQVIQYDNNQAILRVTSADGTVNTMWTVLFNKSLVASNKADIIGVYSSALKQVDINATTNVVTATVKYFSWEKNIDVNMQISAGAFTSLPSFTKFVSDTINNSNQVFISAEDGVSSKMWTINFVREPEPVGASCTKVATAVKGYNSIQFAEFQDSYVMEYTMQSTGTFEVDACESYGTNLATYLSTDCINIDNTATYTYCKDAMYASKAQKEAVAGQKIKIAVSRIENSENQNYSYVTIREISSIVTNFSVSPTQPTIFLGDTVCFNVQVAPLQNLISNVSSSTTGTIIQKHSNFCYIARELGTQTVVFTTTDGSNISKSATVTVVPKPILVSQIVIPSALTLTVGQVATIPAIISPTNASNKGVTWMVSNTSLASIDQYGTIEAKGIGNITVTATAIDAGKVVSNTCAIVIQGVDATGVVVNKTALTLKVGEIFTGLQATVLPINATDKSVTWTSSNPGIVTIVNNSLYAFASGNSVITIALVANPTIKATVNVTVSTTALLVDKSVLTSRIQQHENTVSALIAQNLIGSNSGQYPQSALDVYNLVLADANFLNTSPTATQEEVNQMILDLEQAMKTFQESRIDKILIAYLNIKRDVIACNKGEQKQLYVEILPDNATYTELEFTSNNSAVASVSQSGLITAQSAGQTYVYARSKDGSGKLDSVQVVVSIPLLSLQLPQSISLVQGNSMQLTPIKNPIEALIEGYVWTSEDDSIASVDGFGNVTALKKGAVTVSVVETKSGKVASTVVYIQEQTIAVTGIEIIRDTIVLALGNTDIIYPFIQPYNATDQTCNWTTTHNGLQLMENGIITALNVGGGYVYATTVNGNFKDSVYVLVKASAPPVVQDIEVVIESGTTQVEVPMQQIIQDDNTGFEFLTVQVIGSDNFTATIQNGVLVIEPVNTTIPVTEVVTVVITDVDNQSTTLEIPVTISGIPNQAPEISEDVTIAINTGTSFAPISLQDIVSDDYTNPSQLTYEIITPSENFITFITNGVLEVTRIDANWIGKDSVEIQVTDAAGLSSSQFIVLEVSQALNQAPVLNPIPEQTYNVSTAKYPSLDLKKYVKDDYTPASAIEWTFTPNSKVLITIVNGVATIRSADKNWVGSTLVTFTAHDQDGLTASTSVLFTQPVTGTSTWMSAPKISFTASQTVVGPGADVTFTSSMSGAESWIWEFEGLSLTPQQRIVPNPVVSYSKGGTYKVTLKAMNQYGEDSLVKDNYITVIGIDNINPIVCSGASLTLEATVPPTSGYTYLWNTGESTRSITVNPTANTTYSLTVFKGFFQYEDEVAVQVPTAVSLPDDRAICAGEGFTITVPNFVEYNWNNQGWDTDNSIVVSQAGTTNLQVRDAYGCVTSDDFVITEVYALPVVNLGDDADVCQGSSITLTPEVTNGAAPYSYKWNTNAQTQTISVNADGTYSLEVTDNNNCKASDEVAVTVLRPHNEEIGVATFAKDASGVVIAWERTLGKRTASYEVMRETGEAGTYISIGTLPFNAPESFIEDKDADVLTKSYTYKLITRDSTCNNAAESAPHTTVVASYVIQTTGKATVTWSKYVGLNIPTYRIKKGTSLSNLVQVDSVSGTAASMWNDKVPYQYGTMYRIEMKLPDTVETRWPLLKIESGPFTLALSNIAEATTSIETTLDVGMKVYPTVAVSSISVDFEVEVPNVSFQIISNAGAIVYSTSPQSGSSFEIPVQGIAKGMYTLVVKADNKQQSIPIIIQ